MNSRLRSGFGLMDVLVAIGFTAVVAVIFLPALHRPTGKATRIQCVNNLKNAGLAFRIFATDNNDQFPGAILSSNHAGPSSIMAANVYQWLSNELSTPKLLLCPADKRQEAANFIQLAAKNISYFTSLNASETNASSFLAGDRNILVNGKPVTGLVGIHTNLHLSWSKELHVEQGNICMADGSVQQLSSNRLQQSIRDQELPTNYLAFP